MQGAYQQNHADLLIHGGNAVSSLSFRADLKQASPIDAPADNRIPICFLHGEDDSFIPPEHSGLWRYRHAFFGIDKIVKRRRRDFVLEAKFHCAQLSYILLT